MESKFIGRQPIVNRKQRILGYRLLYEGLPDDLDATDDDAPSVPRPACDLVTHFEEALGGAMGFVEVDIDSLESPFVEALNAKQFVIEFGPLEDHDPAAVERTCRKLRERGLRICLGNYSRRDNRQLLLEHASFIKIDAIATSSSEIKTILRRVRNRDIEVIASRVDLPAQFENLRAQGIDLFQGYFYARPDPDVVQEISPIRAIIIGLLTRVSEHADLREIEETLSENASLGVSLLRLVNGIELARSNKIETVGQALVLIGTHGLSRWLSILLFAGDSDDGQLGPLFKLATCRGKLMERLQVELLDEKSQAEHRDIIERAFLIGMLSLAPVVLGVPPEEAFQELELSDEICSALQDHGGEAGALLNLAESIEDSDLDRILTTLDELDLKRIQLQRAQSESFAWVNGF